MQSTTIAKTVGVAKMRLPKICYVFYNDDGSEVCRHLVASGGASYDMNPFFHNCSTIVLLLL